MALNLKFLRVQIGLTLEQLASDSGLTRSYLSKVERGISKPSIESALKIASALGVTVENLFGRSTVADAVSIVRAPAPSEEEARTYMSLVAGVSQGRLMRAFVLRPGERAGGHSKIMSHHDGEEILYVLTGRIELQIGNRKEMLNVGDCVQFDSTIAHKLRSADGEDASVLVVIVAK